MTDLGLRSPARISAVREFSRWRDLDWLLLAGVATLLGFGAVLVYAATRDDSALTGGAPAAYLQRFVLNAAIGIVLGALVAFVDWRTLRAFVPIVYAGAILGLLAVASPLGSSINGSHSWIQLPAGFSLQPAELAKLAVIVALGRALSGRRDAAGELADGRLRGRTPDEPGRRELVVSVVLVAVATGLVLMQPDLGTAMVFLAIGLGMLVVAGLRARVLIGGLAAAAGGGYVALRFGLLHDYQVARLAAFADPTLDPLGAGYNTAQARAAIGSGGLNGTGLFEGPLTRGGFVPERHTDFIFTVAGEELGFLGSGFLLLVLGLVLWRALRIAARAADLYGRLVAAGVVTWLAVQSFQNIGMTLGIMPVTGLPLPFVSYGGSSMFACLAAVGLLQSVHLQSASRTSRTR